MLAVLRALTIIPIVIAATLRREERRLVDSLRARGAIDKERAVTLITDGAVKAFIHRRLEDAGAIRAAGSNRYYFDEASYDGFRGRRRRRAFIVTTIVVIAIGIGFLTGVITP